jgi:hypothetical protein
VIDGERSGSRFTDRPELCVIERTILFRPSAAGRRPPS